MSLLQNEDFVLYQLRTAYLSHIKDGVGVRLITVNPSVLNDPAFRAAGWLPNASDIQRTYSPPIPTAITAEYFQAPRSAGLSGVDFGEEEEEGGMVTGGGLSNETVGPDIRTRRRRRREQLEEEDSSDLSDESEDEADDRPAHQIKFTKMPVRTRAGSSPLRSTNHLDGPAVLVTSPSRPDGDNRLRRGSLGAVDFFRGRPRKDTTTSSEFSSENELDGRYFQRKQLNPRKAAKANLLLSERIQEDEREGEDDLESVDAGVESDSSLSSEFEGTVDLASLNAEGDPLDSLPTKLPGVPAISTPRSSSPRKPRLGGQPLPALHALPPPRPISMVAPVSLLTQALKAKNQAPASPFDRFATLSGKGDPNPLYIKIYVPSSTKSSKPFEMLLKRFADGGGAATVADAIGLALYRFGEEKLEPAISGKNLNVNRWNFRMIEDEEVDFDFPALTRTRPMTEFTSSNNRPTRGRARDKPWDEFGLVEANEKEFQDNERLTPEFSKQAAEAAATTHDDTPTTTPTPAASLLIPQTQPPPSITPTPSSYRNPIIGPSFTSIATLRHEPSKQLLDAPAVPTSNATPRTGAPKALTIHYTDENFLTRSTRIEVTTDTYIAEVFDAVCKRLGVDKALHVLKVSGSTVVAPPDRTLEALGDRTDLDLVRRRFVGDGVFGLAGSPGSSSPNAPLLIGASGTAKKSKKGGGQMSMPTPQRFESLAALAANAQYKRYNVMRKQPMSFAREASRVLALDGEYIHIMPTSASHHPTTQKVFDQPGKVTTVHFSSVVGSKVSRRHPKTFRLVVYKERESKRYDFEASSAAEAHEIVLEIKRGVNRFQESGL